MYRSMWLRGARDSGVAGCWRTDGKGSLNLGFGWWAGCHLLDIPGLVVGNHSAGIGPAVFMSHRQAAAHESRAQSGVTVSIYCGIAR